MDASGVLNVSAYLVFCHNSHNSWAYGSLYPFVDYSFVIIFVISILDLILMKNFTSLLFSYYICINVCEETIVLRGLLCNFVKYFCYILVTLRNGKQAFYPVFLCFCSEQVIFLFHLNSTHVGPCYDCQWLTLFEIISQSDSHFSLSPGYYDFLESLNATWTSL